MKNLFGIMQGRLLPKYLGNYQSHPVDYWKDEFYLASSFGFDCIEFILDFDEVNKNPLMSESGLENILRHSKKHNILIKSVCADYFMVSPIFIKEITIKRQNFKTLKKLIRNSKIIGVKDIIIPLVDTSSVLNNNSNKNAAKHFLQEIIDDFDNLDINICLETDLPPKEFHDYVISINRPQIRINYDTGNSASLGYNFYDEFESYGNLITNIHIKDRKFGQGSIQIGLGDCDFKNFFQYLSIKKFNGIFIMQAYRDDDGPSSLKPQYEYIRKCMNEYYIV